MASNIFFLTILQKSIKTKSTSKYLIWVDKLRDLKLKLEIKIKTKWMFSCIDDEKLLEKYKTKGDKTKIRT